MIAIDTHHVGDLLLTVHALFGDGDQRLFVKTVFHIQVDQFVVKAAPFVFLVCGHLAEQRYGAHGILVPDLAADHQSITFFTADHIVFLPFFFLDELGDVFEPRQYTITIHSVSPRDLVDQFRRDDGLHYHVRWSRDAFGLPRLDHIIKSKRRRLVTIHQHPLPLLIFNADPYPIGHPGGFT